jgi:hypothetical protein
MTVNSNVATEGFGQSPVLKVIGSGGGRPLEPEVRADMEARLGYDFSRVRVHDDNRADHSAATMNAHAYTVGSDVVFRSGGYSPSTPDGRLTLAHELTHVIQQSQGRVDGTEAPGGLRVSSPGDRFERAAVANAEKGVGTPVPAAMSGLRRGPHGIPDRQSPSGSRPTIAVLQRQAVNARQDAKHPELFPTYEGWLGSFSAFSLKSHGTFISEDRVPGVETGGFEVLGSGAAAAGEQVPGPIDPQKGDKFIDHPTDAWVQANLPEELRQTAYRLPADCADIAVILRHVWLFAHHRSETYRGFTVGFLAGESGAARSKRLRKDIEGIDPPHGVPTMVNPYVNAAGRPERSIKVLAPLLHPGDILLWEHHEGSERGPHAGGLHGGHTQTIMSIDRSGSQLKEIRALQGNQPLPRKTGESLRYTPGRRIEVHTFASFEDVTLPVKGSKPLENEQVWKYGDGHTTLVLAGPPKSGQRPDAKKEHGQTVRHLADWLPAIAAAPRDRLAGVFEAAMREAQAVLERGDPPPSKAEVAEVEHEARMLGRATRVRLDTLDALTAKAPGAADSVTVLSIHATLAVLRSGQGSTNPAVVAQVFTAVTAAFDETVPRLGHGQPLASAHHRTGAEIVVADDQVRGEARAQRAGPVGQAEDAGRGGARGGGHLGDRQAGGDRVPDHAGQGGGAARDRAGLGGVVEEAGHSPGDGHPHRAEAVAAVRHAGGGHGVADQDQPAGALGAGGEADGDVVQVHAVGDHLAGDLIPVEQGAGGARLAVMQGPHAVEQMGRVRRAGVDGGQGDVGGGVGVPDGDGDAGSRRRLDHLGRAGQFGGEGDDLQVTAGRGEQALEGGHVGGEHVPRVLGAAAGRGKERAFQVQAGDDAVVGQFGQHGGAGLQFGERRGDQAGQHGRGAVAPVELRGLPGVVCRTFGERRAAAAVHVDVDKPGEHPLPAQVDGRLPPGPLVRPVAGADRVDQVPGQEDPAGADHAARRDDPAACEQAAGRPGDRRPGGIRPVIREPQLLLLSAS